MSKILHSVGDTFSTAKGSFEVVATSEHTADGADPYHTYTIREKTELDAARQAQADLEAEQIEAQKVAEETQAAEDKRIADLHATTHDPELKQLAEDDQDRLDHIQAGGVR
jgi:hypothetical protein